ncbi:MAG: hypothetical protein K2Z81_09780, partial [Cyanobacteria bacterium]|nr:hypothetical protein [Cyanobacteriota bacterium]
KDFITQNRNVSWLVAGFEKDRFTGAIRSSLDTRKHRSAMLLYEGLVVGCIRSSFAGSPLQHSTEDSLHAMIADLSLQGTAVSYYPLTEKLVIPLSAFFIGSIYNLDDMPNAAQRVEKFLDFIYGDHSTACLVGHYDDDIIFSFFFEGLHHVSYRPGDENMLNAIEDVGAVFEKSTDVMVEAFVAPDRELLINRQVGFRISDLIEEMA